MPTTKDFKKNKKRVSQSHMDEPSVKTTRAKRRPGREEVEETEIHDVEVEVTEEEEIDEASIEAEAEETESGERIEIQFKGSELLRAKFPKTFDLAEEVATQWVHDGSFEGLPIGHPLGQWAAQQSLMKAKEIEKKVVESPIFEKAAIGVLTYGMKAQGLVQKLKDRLQK